MKEVITSVLILVLSHSIWSQGIHSTIYSPVQSGEVILPYAETDFLSIRMRGLGYQLHNVVEDTLTNLFRNPVSTYDLNKSLFIVNYENNEEPRRTVLWLQPVDYIILDGVITNPTGVIIEKPSGKQGLTQGTNLNASTSGIIQPYFNKDFYLSLGYWSPKLWGIVPAGFFLKSNLLSNEGSAQSDLPSRDPFIRNDDVLRGDRSLKDREFFGKFWLGLLNKPGWQLSFSYDLQYFSHVIENESEEIRFQSTANDYRTYKRFGRHDSDYEWIRHRLSFGSALKLGDWEIQPEVSALLFANNEMFDRDDFGQTGRYISQEMDSLLNFDRATGSLRQEFERNINGIEIDLQARRNQTSLFMTASVLNGSVDEFGGRRETRFRVEYGDTTRNDFINTTFQFDDGGMLYRTRLGVGRHFTVKERFNIYSAAVVEYFRNELNGDLSFAGSENLFNYYDTSFIDTSYVAPLDFTSQRWRISLPIGFEYRAKVLSARLGLNWYYRRDEIETQYDFGSGRQDFLQNSVSSGFAGEEFFGFGFRWKNAQLNIAAFSEVFRFSAWHVGLRYGF